MMVTALQFVVALYLISVFAKDFSSGADGNTCLNGKLSYLVILSSLQSSGKFSLEIL